MFNKLTTKIGFFRIRSAFANLVARQKFNRKIAIRRKKNELKILNFPIPYMYEGDPRVRDFYPQDGNPPKKNFENYLYKTDAARMAPFKTFCIPDIQENQDWANSNKLELQKEIIVENRSAAINYMSLAELQYAMQTKHYVMLGHGKEIQKFWFPSSPDVLNGVITVEKLFKFVCVDPLNPSKALKEMTATEIPETSKEKDKIANKRYKGLQRAIEMFILFGISHHNSLVFRDFLISQISDINNLYSLSHNDYNYTATYLIPISWMLQNPRDLLNNPVVNYYTRPSVPSKRRFYDTMADIDPMYKLLKGPREYKSLKLPPNSVTNQTFLRNLDVSLKQQKPSNHQVQQYFLEVAIHSAPEAHKDNNDLTCNFQGWNWRPEIYGQLVTIVPHRLDNLSPIRQRWIEKRIANKI